MNCQDLLKYLNEYVDGAADPGFCEEFEEHMVRCHPCQVVVDNVRQTSAQYQAGAPCELPAGFGERLHSALRRQWKAHDLTGTEP
jgi:hypothetical protein